MIKHVIDDLAPFREKRAQSRKQAARGRRGAWRRATSRRSKRRRATMTEVRETLGL